ncbi:MAG: hypothetical protein ABIJ59_16380 [Pseudomonadota bacterium]
MHTSICKKCDQKFINLYDGICHHCWNKINKASSKNNEELKTYRCPACDKLLFKGNVSSLSMTCPRCNEFVKILKDPL